MVLRANKHRGVALVMVLMITAIMAVIMIFISSKGQNSARLAGLVKANTDALLSIESAQADIVYQYITTSFGVIGPREDYQGEKMSNAMTQDFAGTEKQLAQFTVKVQDISGLVSLQPFNERDFYKLLLTHGVGEEQISRIKDRLNDWQDADNLVHIEGAERGDYNEPFLPTNHTLQNSSELAYILDDSKLLEQIKPYLAFYSGNYIVRQYMPSSLYSAFGLMPPQELNSQSGEMSYPSGRYKIEITANKGVSITKTFVLLRGVGTFRPYFITEDELIFR